ncbi:hypothetical protein D0T84_11460 [Dysgonomonas sp. 521]|uniref:hypothetical protein n=1 Tax=Dysgonomonas sp. 521 TaxID=2302932 RepID=UPI0013CFE126|nr:hypothetical protein [Dysgonomonas sp. 521]NDV95522.1 hypothetical protein [Dysgonomonas sp. 521]
MKKFIVIISIFFAAGLFNLSSAQNINININLDQQPAWGPIGYDYAGYYYFPDINVYFDVANSLFYYLSGSRWISNKYLPSNYRKYDLYSMYKVVINDKQPWLQNKTHKKSYSQYKGDRTQEPIRYSNNTKYNNSKNNTRSWVNTNSSNPNSSNKIQEARESNTSSKNSRNTNNRQSDNSRNTNNANRK